MPELTNYSALQDEDILNIRRLLNPNFDTSEVDRIAAERSLGGGGFSGARRNRLLESERNSRAAQGHSMLEPYLSRSSAAQLQKQAEQAALERQVAQNQAEMQRLQLSLQSADQRQAQEIAARMRELQAQNQAAFERLQITEQGSMNRAVLGEQGANTRHAAGLQTELDRQRMALDSAYQLRQGDWQNSLALADINNKGAFQRAQLGESDTNATMAAINDILSQMGGGRSNTRSSVRMSPSVSGGGFAISPSVGGGPVSNNYNGGNYDSEAWVNPIQTVSGTNTDIIDWGSVDSQINNNQNWDWDSGGYTFDDSNWA